MRSGSRSQPNPDRRAAALLSSLCWVSLLSLPLSKKTLYTPGQLKSVQASWKHGSVTSLAHLPHPLMLHRLRWCPVTIERLSI
jgi:hypothetical protein